MQHQRHTGMIRPQRLLPDGKRAQIGVFSFRNLASVPVIQTQVKESGSHLRIVRAENLLPSVQTLLLYRNRFSVPAIEVCVESLAMKPARLVEQPVVLVGCTQLGEANFV